MQANIERIKSYKKVKQNKLSEMIESNGLNQGGGNLNKIKSENLIRMFMQVSKVLENNAQHKLEIGKNYWLKFNTHNENLASETVISSKTFELTRTSQFLSLLRMWNCLKCGNYKKIHNIFEDSASLPRKFRFPSKR